MNQFLIFALIGVCNTVLDFVLWEIFSKLPFNRGLVIGGKEMLNKFGLAHVFSNLIAFNFSFFMNKTFTFASNVGYWEGFPKLAAFGIFGMILSAKLLSFLTSTPHLQNLFPNNKLLTKYYPKFCKIVTILVVMFVNYFGFKFIVFAGK
jgi:putative flippase GtrA